MEEAPLVEVVVEEEEEGWRRRRRAARALRALRALRARVGGRMVVVRRAWNGRGRSREAIFTE